MREKYNLDRQTGRDSNLELYRIIVMLAIVAHHYVVNSGLIGLINESDPLAFNSLFLLLYGCWGKIGINCFVLITGYFMCRSDITLKKFLKLVLEWLFYKYVIYAIFMISGYQAFTLKGLIKTVVPIWSLTDGFTSCFTVFYLFIPFLNILVRNMNEKQHRYLLCLTIGIFSVWASVPNFYASSSYVFWFMNLYLVSSYIRLYPIPLFSNTKFWGWMSLLAIACSYASVVVMAWMKVGGRYFLDYYFFLSDSNKITALAVAICFFMFFKNVKIPFTPWINRIAASTFGVLCIHAGGDTMRQWLWKDICNNMGFFNSPFLVVHAVGVVLVVFTVCTMIDQYRIRFIEKPIFTYLDKFTWFNKELR